jgi:hypothetical protein
MKTLFNIQVRKADGSFLQKSIQAADVTGKVAIVVAIEAALAAAGAGSSFQSANVLGSVDIDATAAA